MIQSINLVMLVFLITSVVLSGYTQGYEQEDEAVGVSLVTLSEKLDLLNKAYAVETKKTEKFQSEVLSLLSPKKENVLEDTAVKSMLDAYQVGEEFDVSIEELDARALFAGTSTTALTKILTGAIGIIGFFKLNSRTYKTCETIKFLSNETFKIAYSNFTIDFSRKENFSFWNSETNMTDWYLAIPTICMNSPSQVMIYGSLTIGIYMLLAGISDYRLAGYSILNMASLKALCYPITIVKDFLMSIWEVLRWTYSKCTKGNKVNPTGTDDLEQGDTKTKMKSEPNTFKELVSESISKRNKLGKKLTDKTIEPFLDRAKGNFLDILRKRGTFNKEKFITDAVNS